MRCILLLITFVMCLYSVNSAALPIDPRFQSIFNRVQKVSKFFDDQHTSLVGDGKEKLSSD